MLKKFCYLSMIILNFIMFATGKVVLVTGASGDIGLSLTKHFINKGDIVIAHYFNNKVELEKLQKASPNKLYLVHADFHQPETIQMLWQAVLKCCNRVDILINAAGVEQEDLSLSHIQRILNINYLSPRLVCDHAVHHFKEQKIMGIIINIGSRAAYRGMPKGYYTYADAKAALTKYSYDLAKEHAKENIFVYVIAPGPVKGKMFNALKSDVKAQCLESMPTGQVVDIQEIVYVVDFLTLGKVPSATGGVFDLMGASWAH